MALNIILHTFRMIFGNLGQALRVSIGPYAIMIGITLIALVIVGAPLSASDNPADVLLSPGVGLIPLLILPLVLFVTAWVAVSWHRFILLEEYAGVLPAVSGRPIWSYAGKAILLGLLLAVVAIPLFLVLGAAVMPALSLQNGTIDPNAGVPVFSMLIFAVAVLILTFLSLRWGVALVGTALGRPLGFGDAWRATKPVAGTIFGVSALLTVINFLPELILSPINAFAPIIGFVIGLIATWLTMMLGISILTTLYGHVIENRPLVS